MLENCIQESKEVYKPSLQQQKSQSTANTQTRFPTFADLVKPKDQLEVNSLKADESTPKELPEWTSMPAGPKARVKVVSKLTELLNNESQQKPDFVEYSKFEAFVNPFCFILTLVSVNIYVFPKISRPRTRISSGIFAYFYPCATKRRISWT
jgi:hypothetical protein